MIEDPIKILKNMRTIVRNEALAHVGYLGDAVNEDLAASGAVCLGRQACAVGSLWLAAGVKVERDDYGVWLLPGVEEQSDFIEDKTALARAYDAMNRASVEWAENKGITDEMTCAFDGAMENLFESQRRDGSRLIEASEFLPIIDRAMELIAEESKTQADTVKSIVVDDWNDTVTIIFEDCSKRVEDM